MSEWVPMVTKPPVSMTVLIYVATYTGEGNFSNDYNILQMVWPSF